MKIQQLQVFNFKSYCGKRIIGPFNQQFTCIIGPNGNGKSNILDAMLFVFGFKSSKLRQDSLPALIHNSAFGRPDQAKVTVKFIDKKSHLKNSDNNNKSYNKNSANNNALQHFSISRTIRRNGYSFYQLNDKKITWTQLKQILIQKSVDLQKNLFIILQGQVQRLCELSAQKLVQYLQYVSGSDQYINTINSLQLDFADSIIQCQKYKQRTIISNKIFKKSQKQAFNLIQHIILKIKILEYNLLIVKKSRLLDRERITKTSKELQKLNQNIQQIQKILQTMLQQKQQYIKKQSFLVKQIQQLNIQIQNQQCIFYNLEKNQLSNHKQQLQYRIKDLQNKQREYNMVIREKDNLEKMIQNVQGIRGRYDKIEKEIQNIGGIKSQVYWLLKECCKMKKDKDKIQNVIKNDFDIKVGELKVKLTNINEKKHNHIRIYGQNCQKFKYVIENTARLKVKVRQLAQSQISHISKINKLNQNIDQIKRRIIQSENQKKNLSNHQKIINQIKMAHKLKIILPYRNQISTLRQKIIIESCQDAKLINVITPQLDYIFLDKYQQARIIIDYLNVRKIGRMSFVLRSQIENIITDDNMRNFLNNKIKLPLNTRRIFDLGNPVQKSIQKIWYWAVGNTLISQTLQDAANAAFHSFISYRVISKKGQFIDISGAMTKLTLNDNKKGQIEDKVILQSRLKVLMNNLDTEMNKLKLVRQQKQKANEKIINQSKSKIHYEQINEQEIKNNFTAINQQLKQIENELKILQNKRTLQNQNLQKIKQKLKQNQQKFIKLKQKQKNKNLSKYSYQQIIKLFEQHQNLTSQLKKIDISAIIIQNHQKKLKEVKQNLYQIQEQIDKCKNKIQGIEKKIKQNKYNIIKKIQKKKQKQHQISLLEQKVFFKEIEIQRIKGEFKKPQQFKKLGNFCNEGEEQQNDYKEKNIVKTNNKNKEKQNNKKKGQIVKKNNKTTSQKVSIFQKLDLSKTNQKQTSIIIQDYFQLQHHPNTNNNNSDKPILQQSLKQQTRLRNQIKSLQNLLIKHKNDYIIIIQSLKSIYNFLTISGKTKIQQKIQQKMNQMSQQIRKQQNSKIIQQKIQKMQIQQQQQIIMKGQNEGKLKKQIKQNKNKNNNKNNNKVLKIRQKLQQKIQVKFQDILIDYLSSLGLKNINQLLKQELYNKNNLNENQKNKVQLNKIQTSNQKIKKIKILNVLNDDDHNYKNNNHNYCKSFFSKLIYEGFFNSHSIFNIGPNQQYFFNDFISQHQRNYIISSININESDNNNQLSQIIKKFELKINNSQQQQQKQTIYFLDLEKIKFLSVYNQQRLHELQKLMGAVNQSANKKIKVKERLSNMDSAYKNKINLDNNDKYQNDMTLIKFDIDQCPLDQFQMEMLSQYVARKTQNLILQAEFQTVKSIQKDILKQLSRLRQMRVLLFVSCFNLINCHVNKIYNYLTGGNAQLNMTNSINPFQGVQFSVRPNKKSWKRVNLLSGGQKTLSSLALIFACEQIKKFPFYFMDEIDAALDYKNVTNLGKYISTKKQVQHIVISLRKNMYQQCDSLICIYKVKDITLTIKADMKDIMSKKLNNQINKQNKQNKQYHKEQKQNQQIISLNIDLKQNL